MAGCSKKQYAIMMSAGEEGKSLASKMGSMEQDAFNDEFSKLLGSGAYKPGEGEKEYNRDEDEDYGDFDADSEDDYGFDEEDENSSPISPENIAQELVRMKNKNSNISDDEIGYLAQAIHDVAVREENEIGEKYKDVKDLNINELIDSSSGEIHDLGYKLLFGDDEEDDYEEDNLEAEENQYLDKTWRSSFENKEGWTKNDQGYYDMAINDHNYGWVQYGAREDNKINVGYVVNGDHDHPKEALFDDPEEAREFVEEGLKGKVKLNTEEENNYRTPEDMVDGELKKQGWSDEQLKKLTRQDYDYLAEMYKRILGLDFKKDIHNVKNLRDDMK